jgi:hypothetical protein
MQTLRIFISSPGDVAEERQITGKVIERLQGKYWSFVRLDDVFWEQKVVRSTAHYQDELINPGDCEMVLGIVWSRLGSPLPEKFRKQTGERYQSGTEWELEMAFDAYEKDLAQTGDAIAAKPDIIIYRRRAPRPVHEDEATDAMAAEQARNLDAYLKENYWFPDGTIKRPITGYTSLEEFETKLSLDLEQLILRHIPGLKPGFEPPPISGSPFKGLHAFDFKDSDRYFGRNREIREIQQQLLASARKGLPFLLIYGGSGYGKSSLMRAGLAPVLTRPGGSLDEIHGWRRVPFQPAKGNGTLVERLARAILQPPTPEEAEQSRAHKHWPLTGLSELSGASIDNTPWDAAATGDTTKAWDSVALTRHFSDDDRRVFAIAAIVQTLESLNRHLLLEIDQLEELFTTPEFDETQRAAFLKTIGDLTATGRVWTVATMRSEFFPRIAEQPELFHLVGKDRGYILPPPDRQSLREIIRYPALAARLEFERRDKEITISIRKEGDEFVEEKAKHDYLHDQILADAEDSPDALPLLEFVLQQLYEGRDEAKDLLTWNSYVNANGLKGAIAKCATDVYQELDLVAKEARHRIFASLVHIDPAKGTITRKRARLEYLKIHPGSETFLRAFLTAHLLITDEDAQKAEPVVTLAHEALISHWDELSHWIKEHRSDLLAHQRLDEQTRLWTENSEKKSYLLSEARLAEAERVAESGLFDLNLHQSQFLKRSQKRTLLKKRLLQLSVGVFASLALAASLAGWRAKKNGEEAITQKNDAITQRKLVETTLYHTLVRQSSNSIERNANREAVSELALTPSKNRQWEWEFLAQRVGFSPELVEISRETNLDSLSFTIPEIKDLISSAFQLAELNENLKMDEDRDQEPIREVVSEKGNVRISFGSAGRGGGVATISHRSGVSWLDSETYVTTTYGDVISAQISRDETVAVIIADDLRHETTKILASSFLNQQDHKPSTSEIASLSGNPNVYLLPIRKRIRLDSVIPLPEPEFRDDNIPQKTFHWKVITPGNTSDRYFFGIERTGSDNSLNFHHFRSISDDQGFYNYPEMEIVDLVADNDDLTWTPPNEVSLQISSRLREWAPELRSRFYSWLNQGAPEIEHRIWTSRREILAIHPGMGMKLVVVKEPNGSLATWNLETFEKIKTLEIDAYAKSIWQMPNHWYMRGCSFSDEGSRLLVVPGRLDRALIFDTFSLEFITEMKGEILRAVDQSARPGSPAKWRLSPKGSYAGVVYHDPPSGRTQFGIGSGLTGVPISEGEDDIEAMEWSPDEGTRFDYSGTTNALKVQDLIRKTTIHSFYAKNTRDRRMHYQNDSLGLWMVDSKLFSADFSTEFFSLSAEVLWIDENWESIALLNPSSNNGLPEGFYGEDCPMIEIVEIPADAQKSKTLARRILDFQIKMIGIETIQERVSERLITPDLQQEIQLNFDSIFHPEDLLHYQLTDIRDWLSILRSSTANQTDDREIHELAIETFSSIIENMAIRETTYAKIENWLYSGDWINLDRGKQALAALTLASSKSKIPAHISAEASDDLGISIRLNSLKQKQPLGQPNGSRSGTFLDLSAIDIFLRAASYRMSGDTDLADDLEYLAAESGDKWITARYYESGEHFDNPPLWYYLMPEELKQRSSSLQRYNKSPDPYNSLVALGTRFYEQQHYEEAAITVLRLCSGFPVMGFISHDPALFHLVERLMVAAVADSNAGAIDFLLSVSDKFPDGLDGILHASFGDFSSLDDESLSFLKGVISANKYEHRPPETCLRVMLTVEKQVKSLDFAKRHGITLDELNDWNNISLDEEEEIAKGSTLRVPLYR